MSTVKACDGYFLITSGNLTYYRTWLVDNSIGLSSNLETKLGAYLLICNFYIYSHIYSFFGWSDCMIRSLSKDSLRMTGRLLNGEGSNCSIVTSFLLISSFSGSFRIWIHILLSLSFLPQIFLAFRGRVSSSSLFWEE